MDIAVRINQVMNSLEGLKEHVQTTPVGADSKFESILEMALDSATDEAASKTVEPRLEELLVRPNNLKAGHGYDPKTAPKPSMRELMEALTGRSMESLYSDPKSNWQETSRLASDLLYGVVGSNTDTRDWAAIMASDDIVQTARKATREMYAPTLAIQSVKNSMGNVIDQNLAINDADGNVLRILKGNAHSAQNAIENFGLIPESITENLIAGAKNANINAELLNMLEEFASTNEAIVAS